MFLSAAFWIVFLLLVHHICSDCYWSLVSILLAVSTACLRSSIGNKTQYNFVGNVFLNTSKIAVLHTPTELLPALFLSRKSLWFLCFCQMWMISTHEITVNQCYLTWNTFVWINFVIVPMLCPLKVLRTDTTILLLLAMWDRISVLLYLH